MFKRLMGMVVMAITLLASLVWTGDDASAQRRRLRVAGRTGNRTNRDTNDAERRSRRAGEAGTLTVEEQFARFPDAPAALNLTAASLRAEFDLARSTYPRLTPAHLIAARLLVGFAREARPDVRVTAEDFFDGLRNGKGYRATLAGKGFTDDEAESAMRQLKNKMDELERSSD